MAEVDNPDTGIGPDAYSLLMCFAKELERTPHNAYNRYTFFRPGPNWLPVLSPIVVIKDVPQKGPRIELRFPLFGVYDPLGCAKWYYQSPAQRTFSDADIKVSWAVLIIQGDIKLDMSSGTPVLNILIDITDPDSVSFNEGNLNEGLDSRIQKMTIDPDWKGTPADWRTLVKQLMARHYDSFLG